MPGSAGLCQNISGSHSNASRATTARSSSALARMPPSVAARALPAKLRLFGEALRILQGRFAARHTSPADHTMHRHTDKQTKTQA